MRVTYKLKERDWITFDTSNSSSALAIRGVLFVSINTVTVDTEGLLFSEGNIRKNAVDAFLQFMQMTNHRSGGGRHAHM